MKTQVKKSVSKGAQKFLYNEAMRSIRKAADIRKRQFKSAVKRLNIQ
jgi:hypothetical protein